MVKGLIKWEGIYDYMQIHTTLRHYSRIIRQRFVFILLGILFCVSATGLISICIPPVYQAKTLLKVNSTATSSSNDVYNAQALAVDYALLVTSPEVLGAAAQRLPGVTIGKLQQVISDAPIENTQIIEIRAQAEEARLAANMANMVATIFIQLQAKKETDRLQNSANLLTQHIAATRLDLDAAQEYLNVLQNNHAAPASIAQQKSLVDTDQANYGLLLTDYSQLQVQKLQAANILSIAQAAQPPDRPDSPQTLTNMLLAAAMSLLLMILLVLLLDWLDTTIKTGQDVINMAGQIPLGCIPASSRAEGAELLNLAAKSCAPAREALSMVGINLRAQLKGQRFLLVSGTRTNVGATTVAVYLAISLAQTGMRVLLLDANHRRPLLHEVFHGPNTNGLSNRLADIERFQEQPTIYPHNWLQHWKTPIANLWLLPAGPPPVQSAATTTQGLQKLKEWLLGERQMPDNNHMPPLIDLIICDTTPLDEGSDTYALSMIADGIVMVIEAGKEQKEMLCDTHAIHLHAPLLGVVVNRQKVGQTTYYYANSHNAESMAIVHKLDANEEGGSLQAPGQHTDNVANSLTYEKQTISEVPGIRFAATHAVTSRKIAEHPAPLMSTPRPAAPLTLITGKLARINAPKTPIVFPLSSPGEYTPSSAELLTGDFQQIGNVQASDAVMPFPLRKGRIDATTDPLTGTKRRIEPELQGMVQETKTQFKTRPGKRA